MPQTKTTTPDTLWRNILEYIQDIRDMPVRLRNYLDVNTTAHRIENGVLIVEVKSKGGRLYLDQHLKTLVVNYLKGIPGIEDVEFVTETKD